MSLFDYLDQLIINFRSINGLTWVASILLTFFGLLALQLITLKLLFATFQGLRLYVFSQFCCNNSDTRKYGEWVVVTGATDGIGQSMAREFARRGHSIIVVGRNEQKLASTKTLLESEPNVGQVETITIDLSDSSLENYERVADQMDSDNRDIGILVNCAGVATDKFMVFTHYDMDSIRRQVNVNILATAYFTKLILPGMLARRRGLIVNVSSIAGETSLPLAGVYAATKSFVNAFSRSLQIECPSSGGVNIINLTPGPTRTKMLDGMFPTRGGAYKLAVSSEDYARSALNAIGTRIDSFSGCWKHALINSVLRITDKYSPWVGVRNTETRA